METEQPERATRWPAIGAWAMCIAGWGGLPPAAAQAGAEAAASAEAWAFKLTPSYYATTGQGHAWDFNLRGARGAHTAWLGLYRDDSGFRQSRTGYEYRQDLGLARTVLSVQAASGGFWGGSVSAEIGGDSYALAGWGRTNLRNYYNLNFDPNDAITLGLGTRALPRTELSLFQLWDDRLHTGQRVGHGVLRYRPNDGERWTLDLAHKQGLTGSGQWIRGTAATLTYDWGEHFVRLARDPYVNFSDSTQTRVSLGLRF